MLISNQLLSSVALVALLFYIDDPVGAIPVHLFCGFWGTMAVGFFSTKGAEEFARGSAQDNWLSQVVFQFFSMDCSHGIYFYF